MGRSLRAGYPARSRSLLTRREGPAGPSRSMRFADLWFRPSWQPDGDDAWPEPSSPLPSCDAWPEPSAPLPSCDAWPEPSSPLPSCDAWPEPSSPLPSCDAWPEPSSRLPSCDAWPEPCAPLPSCDAWPEPSSLPPSCDASPGLPCRRLPGGLPRHPTLGRLTGRCLSLRCLPCSTSLCRRHGHHLSRGMFGCRRSAPGLPVHGGLEGGSRRELHALRRRDLYRLAGARVATRARGAR